MTGEGRATLRRLELSPSARQTVAVALAMVDSCERQLAPRERELTRYARGQAGCRALMEVFGIGPLLSTAILAELGDARRFSSSRHAVRFAGLDITVYASDAHRAPGRLATGLDAARQAAAAGRDATTPMLARKGRASYLGERSVGHQDPGATSTVLIFAALERAARAAG